MSMGLDGIHPRVLRELVDGIADLVFIIFLSTVYGLVQPCSMTRKVVAVR